MNIWDFLSKEAGQERSRKLNQAIEYYTPPELRGLLNFFGEMSPTTQAYDAGTGFNTMVSPSSTTSQRIGGAGQMLSGMAGIVAPAALEARFGKEAANAVADALTSLPAKELSQMATNAVSDATYAGRSAVEGDIQGIFDVFRPSREAQPLSAFGGERAMGFNQQEANLLQKAKDMFASGESNARVFGETGWFKGADGKLRFEINDQAATVKNMDAQTLGEFLDHPELFRLYPNLRNNPVSAENMSSGSLGSYNPRTMMVKVQRDTPENVKSPLMHEVQHALQDVESFSRGSTPSDGYSQEQAQRFAQNIMENESAAKSRQAFYDTQGASAELRPLYTAQYIDRLDSLTERALDGRAKPRDITRLGEWYRWGDEIRSNLGPMPKKAGRERDYWIASAARQLRDKEIESLDDYARLSYEDVLNRFETPKDRANAVNRIERRRDKTAPASREYYQLTKRAKEAQQLDAIDAYLKNAGEVEARNVQTRLDPEKSKLFPWATQDYDYNQQIIDNFSKYDNPSNIYLSLGADRNNLFGYDNPKGDWLKGKIKRADQNIAEGGVGITGPTTAYTKESIMLPIERLSSLKGALGESPSAGQPKLDDLMQSVQKEGFRNDSPILVGVNHRGEPYIVEGNNRVAVAKAMGVDRIPAEVRWYNGGEDVATNWSPQSVEAMTTVNASKPVGLLVLEQQARGNERLGGLLTQAGFDINDLSTANVSDLEKLLHAAANQGIVDPRSANNLMRGLLK